MDYPLGFSKFFKKSHDSHPPQLPFSVVEVCPFVEKLYALVPFLEIASFVDAKMIGHLLTETMVPLELSPPNTV